MTGRTDGGMNATRLPADNCPWCGYLLDAASPLAGNAIPKPGNLSLCLSCGSVLQFGAEMRVQKITDAAVRDALSAKAYDDLMKTRRVLLSMDRTKLSRRGRK